MSFSFVIEITFMNCGLVEHIYNNLRTIFTVKSIVKFRQVPKMFKWSFAILTLFSAARLDRRWKSAVKWQKAVCAPVRSTKAEWRYLQKSLLLYICKYIHLSEKKTITTFGNTGVLTLMTSATSENKIEHITNGDLVT